MQVFVKYFVCRLLVESLLLQYCCWYKASNEGLGQKISTNTDFGDYSIKMD